jgi:EAL domain-containing protein (putative c-di-GMP-specific phosphodiesterase class I)/CheY-like chemotaxis protein
MDSAFSVDVGVTRACTYFQDTSQVAFGGRRLRADGGGMVACTMADPGTRTRSRHVVGRVLVVDDESVVARVFGRVLSAEGHEVTVCHDGEQALLWLDQRPFDVVLSDISMPGLDGIALLRKVRGRDLDLPVVLVTGAPSLDSAIDAVEYGATRYLQKPVEASVLCEAVQHAVGLRKVALLRREMLDEMGDSRRQIADRAGLEVRFEHALATLHMVFQPVVSWSTRTLFAYEAFVRSSEPTLVTPRSLFDTARRLGRTDELTERIHALCAKRIASLPPYVLLFVNMDPTDFLNVETMDQHSALVPHAERVVFEVTERAALEQIPDLRPRVSILRQYGFRMALDDIGAGYAGLSSFTLLDPDIVKLDNVLVHDVDSSPTKKRLVASMTRLCGDLGMQVVAEGVETAAERDVLAELGCDIMQGYLFAYPTETLVTPLLETM